MGFFSDLKEDLNQAVNELLPDGEKGEAKAPVAQAPVSEAPKPIKQEEAENDVMKEIEELEATLRGIDEL